MEVLKEGLDALHFKEQRFTNKASFLAFIKGLIKHADPECNEFIVDKVMRARNTPPLSHAQHLELLRYCVVRGRSPCPTLLARVAQVLTSTELFELLQLCFNWKDRPAWSVDSDSDDDSSWADLDDLDEDTTCPLVAKCLLELPAAQGLTSEQILDMLQLMTQCSDSGVSWRDANVTKLLSLPAARGISGQAAQRLLLVAFEAGAMSAVDSLCRRLPACAAAWAELDPAVLQQVIKAALKSPGDNCLHLSDGTAILALLKHPKLQQYAENILPDVLLAAFQLSNAAGFRVRLLTPCLVELLQLPAASCLSVHVVQRLMQAAIQTRHPKDLLQLDCTLHQQQLLQVLVELPAAAQISTQGVQELLQSALRRGRKSVGGATVEACSPQQAGSSAQPPRPRRHQQQQRRQRWQRQQDEVAAVAEPHADSRQLAHLALQCLQRPCGAAALFPLLRLPWAQHLPAPAVGTLLQAAGERQDRAVFDRLLALPQAPRGDADVQRFAEVVRFIVGDPHLCDVPPPQGAGARQQTDSEDEGSEDEGSEDEGGGSEEDEGADESSSGGSEWVD